MTDLLPIVDSLLALPEWPWHIAGDDAKDCPAHKDSGLALVDTGRAEDWPIARLCEWGSAKVIVPSPLWLAQLIVALVEEREQRYMNTGDVRKNLSRDAASWQALKDFNLTEEKYEELKRRLKNSVQSGQRDVL